MAEEWIIVCNCGEQTWLLCADRIVCPKCKAEHEYDDIIVINDGGVPCINMDNTDRVKQMVDVEAL